MLDFVLLRDYLRPRPLPANPRSRLQSVILCLLQSIDQYSRPTVLHERNYPQVLLSYFPTRMEHPMQPFWLSTTNRVYFTHLYFSSLLLLFVWKSSSLLAGEYGLSIRSFNSNECTDGMNSLRSGRSYLWYMTNIRGTMTNGRDNLVLPIELAGEFYVDRIWR